MRNSRRRLDAWRTMGWLMVGFVMVDSTAWAQSPRSRAPRQGQAATTIPDVSTSFAPGQAAAGVPSPFAAFNGSANRPVRRYRGNNNEFTFPVGPSGRNVGSMNPNGAGGFTLDKVHEGYYMPGFGVNNGFAAPEQVYGGYYTPGWGVMGGLGNFGGSVPNQQLQGGTYIPGFGVGGGPALLGNFGSPTPTTNLGGPVSGFTPSAGGAVSGGTYIPGFGVSGGR